MTPRGPLLACVLIAASPVLSGCAFDLPPAAPSASHTAAPHPLDPLGPEELARAAALLHGDPRFPRGGTFSMITLEEPPKDEVLAFAPGLPFRREAAAVIHDRIGAQTLEAVVDLRAGKVTRWRAVPGAQPFLSTDEYDVAAALVRADPRWQRAMRARGIPEADFRRVGIDTWAAGPAPAGAPPGARLARALSFYRGDRINYYGQPIEGVVALLDLDERRVLDVTDTGPVPIPASGQDLDEASIGRLRAPPRPLVVTQPDGPSFRVEGHEVSWQSWRFRYSFNAREGLVLHRIGYEDRGRLRSIAYRAAISEVNVPYGDPDPAWSWRAAFDAGEYGLGNLAAPLDVGLDLPHNARTFDADLIDGAGRVVTLPRAVGIYERDGGLLWKHYDMDSRSNAARRARELVITFGTTVGNYDYVLRWIFRQDGSIACEIGLTGMLLAKGTDATRVPAPTCPGCTGHLVAPNVVAPNHQHFFSLRLDMDVDGTQNALVETNAGAIPRGPMSPEGNAILGADTLLARESEAQRDVHPESARCWRVVNPAVRNALGNPVGYMLVPGPNAFPLALPGSSDRRRGGFLAHHLWATLYKPGELYAAGDYPNQAPEDTGLSRWAADDERIEDRDLVLWYTLGMTHIPREEEWPIMTAQTIGFQLVPAGFFDRNPALDVPE